LDEEEGPAQPMAASPPEPQEEEASDQALMELDGNLIPC
jgi:hypothetical protein